MMRPQQREYYGRVQYHPGPSPWVPATILGIILLIVTVPYMKTPDPTIAYQTVRRAPSFPLPLLWIPVVAVIALQFFGGNRQYSYDSFGRPMMRPGAGGAGIYGGGPGGRYGEGGPMYAGGANRYSSRGFGADRMMPEYNRGWGGSWWPWGGSYNRYNTHQQRGLMSSFMDYGGHWMLILLGIAVFTLVGSSSSPSGYLF